MAAWFGGTAESNPDVAIYTARLKRGHWSAPVLTAVGLDKDGSTRLACYNPVLFQPSAGPLLLFYKVGRGPQTWWGMMAESKDHGETWSKPTPLPDGILGPIKNHPLQLKDGTLICPSSSEDHGWKVHFEFTKDLGKTWTRTKDIPTEGKIEAIQPSILTANDGSLKAVGRTKQGFLFSTSSPDLGQTWSPIKLLDVPNPNSGADATTLKDGRFILVNNNTPNGRTPLNVLISDDGTHWKTILTLEDGPGEYSYPTVIQASDGRVHIVYTWNRKRIKHVVLKV